MDGAQRLATGAQGEAGGGAEVERTPPTTRRTEAARPAAGADQAQVGHEAVGLVELVDRALGEVLGAQHLAVAPPQGEHRTVDELVGLRRGGGVVVGVDQDRDRLHGRHLARPVAGLEVLEHGGEGPVVGGDVLGPADERGPAGPVDGRSRPMPTSASADA